MNAPVFISHATADRRVADAICSAVEGRGIRCWIAYRDVRPGEHFAEAIVRAIRNTRVMVLVFSAQTNSSDEVKKELVLAGQSRLVVIPLRIENVDPNEAFAWEFAIRQYIDVFAGWDRAIDRLITELEQVVARVASKSPEPPPEPELERKAAARTAESKADGSRMVEQARQAEIARLAEEERKAEAARKAEEARQAEIARLNEEERKANALRTAAEVHRNTATQTPKGTVGRRVVVTKANKTTEERAAEIRAAWAAEQQPGINMASVAPGQSTVAARSYKDLPGGTAKRTPNGTVGRRVVVTRANKTTEERAAEIRAAWAAQQQQPAINMASVAPAQSTVAARPYGNLLGEIIRSHDRKNDSLWKRIAFSRVELKSLAFGIVVGIVLFMEYGGWEYIVRTLHLNLY